MQNLSLALLGALLIALPVRAEQPFATAQVAYREVDRTYAAEAVVEAVNQSTVSAQISGRVVEVAFDVGDEVKKGQVLVRIDESEVRQSVAGSEAQVAQAQASLQNARIAYERSRQLLARNFISQSAVDKAQADYKAAEAQLKAALAGAGQASATKSFATIVAPYSGIVSARHVELGEMANPGKPLMTGFDPRGLRVTASIPQYKLAEILKNPRARVEFPETGRWVAATRVSIQPVADVRTHTTRARIDLPENMPGVFPGVFARAHFAVGLTRKLLIPAAAVVSRSEVTAVYTVDRQGGIHFRQVRLGEPVGPNEVEVLAGLASGEMVATEPVKAGMALKAVRSKQ